MIPYTIIDCLFLLVCAIFFKKYSGLKLIGEIFKENREKLGFGLKEVAHNLKIRYEYLRALEENSFESLPADVYTKGYIREYARFLGIDSEPLLKAYDKQRAPTDQNKGIQPESPQPKKGFNYPLVLLIVSILVIFAANIYLYYQKTVNSPGKSKDTRISAYNKNSHSPANPDKIYRLSITAMEKTWLRIEPAGEKPQEVLMKPGDSKEWTSKDGFNIKIGNAGGVNVILNGKDIGKLGKRGQVLTVRLPDEKP